MKNSKSYILLGVFFCLLFCFCRIESAYAKDIELMPEQLIAQHLKSLGSTNALSAIRTRTALSAVTFTIIRGSSGQASGEAQWASEKGKTGLVLKVDPRFYVVDK